jgi:3-hydroxyisobutyrate dehydrogenase
MQTVNVSTDAAQKQTKGLQFKIAFIGIGHMGYPIAVRMANAGHDVVGFDILEKTKNKFVAEGNTIASSPADAASHADL